VLLGKECRRHQDRDLPAVKDRSERRPHGDFSLAVPHITAQEQFHGSISRHEFPDLFHGTELVGSLLIGEEIVKLAVQRRVGAESVAPGGLPLGVELRILPAISLIFSLILCVVFCQDLPPRRSTAG